MIHVVSEHEELDLVCVCVMYHKDASLCTYPWCKIVTSTSARLKALSTYWYIVAGLQTSGKGPLRTELRPLDTGSTVGLNILLGLAISRQRDSRLNSGVVISTV